MREARGLIPDPFDENICQFGRGQDADQHALGIVGNIAGEAKVVRDTPDIWAKADALYCATNSNAESFGHGVLLR